MLRKRRGGADVREVRQPLRIVSEHLVRRGVVFLGEESEVVATGDAAVEHLPRVIAAVLSREALGENEQATKVPSRMDSRPCSAAVGP